MKYRKLNTVLLCAYILVMLTGCRNVQIFETNTDPNEQIELTDKQLEKSTYYVKNGTKFIEVYKPKGNAKDYTNTMNKSRVFYFLDDTGDENLVPEHYKGELIAYASGEDELTDITLERFKDMGYSFGIYGGTIQNDGYYHLNMRDKKSAVGSQMEQAITETQSDDIRIKSIDGINVSDKMVDPDSGIFLGLERGKSYKIEFFAGTYYYEADIKADTHYLQSYEMYTYDEEYLADTKNGYVSFETPENLKSGWYNVNGMGVFQYYDFRKGEKQEETADMNQSFYETEEEMIYACSDVYTFTVENETANVRVEITRPETETAELQAYVFAPDQTKYIMDYDAQSNMMRLNIAKAMPGKWQINILPRNSVIKEINAYAEEADTELTVEEYEQVFEADEGNIVICLDYSGEGTVNATIESPSGETYIMEDDNSRKEINGEIFHRKTYLMRHVPAGTYKIKVYHYPTETTIGEPYYEDQGETSKDVIVVTE